MAQHRRNVGNPNLLDLHAAYPSSLARCEGMRFNSGICQDQQCPAHHPVEYAAYRAKHCPDSIFPVDRDPWRK